MAVASGVDNPKVVCVHGEPNHGSGHGPVTHRRQDRPTHARVHSRDRRSRASVRPRFVTSSKGSACLSLHSVSASCLSLSSRSDTPCDARSHEECPPFAIITELRRAHGAVTTLLTPSLIRTLHTITQGGGAPALLAGGALESRTLHLSVTRHASDHYVITTKLHTFARRAVGVRRRAIGSCRSHLVC